jgi:type IV pilus assembly protein PilA
MKSEFKAKFLQNLVSKKKGNEGFTLIELLVVIIIVGVLAAIALPSFLNQIGKARASEAKSNIGTINRAQQAYRLEEPVFGPNLTNLDAKISGKFYSYVVSGTGATTASVTANRQSTDIKNYAGNVVQTVTAGADFFGQAVCEAPSSAPGAIPTATAPVVSGVQGTCANSGTIID